MRSSATGTAIDGVIYPESYAGTAGCSSRQGYVAPQDSKDMPPVSLLYAVVEIYIWRNRRTHFSGPINCILYES
jgi:hypothetical protein